ncbi:MAG: tetratricopeptide repeat protein, partial [Candidatus Acidiferrales bacterium]
MTRIARAALCAGIFACALTGAGRQTQQSPPPQQHAHSRASAAKNADAAGEQEKTDPRAEIIRENNFGVALMNRQQFEQALGKFQRACILDPQTDIGCLNTGIALLNMQRFEEARQILEKSAQRNPRDPHAWFNLGLLEKATGNAEAAVADFQKVAALDSYDADTQYFIGLVYSQQQQYDKAIPAFQRALALNPFQVSAEFGLAQALQRTNKTAQAKEHFDRFQHMTSLKLGKPVSFIYGEQGKYSLAEIMQPAPEPVPLAMPVH